MHLMKNHKILYFFEFDDVYFDCMLCEVRCKAHTVSICRTIHSQVRFVDQIIRVFLYIWVYGGSVTILEE